MEKDKVVLYSTGCPECIRIKSMLLGNKVDFIEINDVKQIKKIAEKNNISFVPFADINGTIMGTNELKKWMYERRQK